MRATPPNPDYAAAIRESFARQTMMLTIGATIARIAPGEVDLEMPHMAAFCQQNGYLHAGATASLADSANGYAAYTLAPAGSDVLAVEFKINLLAPAKGDSYIARGRVIRPGGYAPRTSSRATAPARRRSPRCCRRSFFAGFGIRDSGFGIRDSGFGIRDPGIRDPRFAIRDSRFEIGD